MPTPVTFSVPLPTLDAAKLSWPLLVNETLLAPELNSATGPLKVFCDASAIAPAPALNVAVPAPGA
jgi:hypothetical protein